MEAHCSLLCQGLRDAGHKVTLFATAGSDDPDLVPICDPYEIHLPWHLHHGTPALRDYQHAAFESAWSHVLSGGFEVVHNNTLFPSIIDWAQKAGVPCVTSQHVPPYGAMRSAVSRAREPGQIVTVTSRSQLPLWGAMPGVDLRVVLNGVDCRRWGPADNVGDQFCWSGRVTPNKGLAEAVAAARLADVPLNIFGPMEDPTYFEERVQPHLDDRRLYWGHVGYDKLVKAVATARAAIVTPMWDEPFGLVRGRSARLRGACRSL